MKLGMITACALLLLSIGVSPGAESPAPAQSPADRPHIILMMSDDQGWGMTGYNGHPHLKTPNLDAMADSGLVFTRFYAAWSMCTPTRASFLTGRHPFRSKVNTIAKPLPIEEKTIGHLAKAAGYRTALYGKWHLNGVGGPGKPIAADDPLSPGKFGFDYWEANSNFFEKNPELGSPNGVVAGTGDSSDVLIQHAIDFLRAAAAANEPALIVISYPSPHSPWNPLPQDAEPYASLPPDEANCYGEITAMDRSVGLLRQTLRDLKMAENTLLLFCSDNGGVLKTKKEEYLLTNGGLRGKKNSIWEGGIRVPGIIEWPAKIAKGSRTDLIASTSDIYPTLQDLLNVQVEGKPMPLDGVSLMPLIRGEITSRPDPLFFWQTGNNHAYAVLEGKWKYYQDSKSGEEFLFDLEQDKSEQESLASANPELLQRMRDQHAGWRKSVENSMKGKDYK